MKLIFLGSIFAVFVSQFQYEAAPSCKEIKLSKRPACVLKKIKIIDENDTVAFDSWPSDEIRFLKIDREKVKFLSTNLMKNFQEIQILQVTESELQKIEKSTFESLLGLEEINLENNRLSELKTDTFENLISLTYLNLAKNRISKINSATFEKNSALKRLTLDFNLMEKFHENTLKNLIKLETFSMSDNKLSEIREGTFKTNVVLAKINLANNALKFIGATTFTIPGGKLNKLSLSGNECIKEDVNFMDSDSKLLKFDVIEREIDENCKPFEIQQIEKELEICQLKKENDRKKFEDNLIIAKENCAETTRNMKQRIETIQAETFEIEKNATAEIQLLKMKQQTLDGLLKVSKNYTETCDSLYDDAVKAKEMALIKLIECESESRNNVTERLPHESEAFDDTKAQIENLTKEIEKFSKFEFECKDFTDNTCHAEGIAIPNDEMTIRQFNTTQAQNFEKLFIKKSVMTFIPSNFFKVFSNVLEVEISDSNVKFISRKTFESAPKIHHLVLTNNLISRLPELSFEKLAELKILNLESSSIKTIESRAFQGANAMEKLNLRMNMIEEIPEHTFDNLSNLKNLNLALNRIQHLRGHLFEMNTNLEVVLINKNPLKSLGENLFENCNKLQSINYGNTDCIKENMRSTNKNDFKKTVSKRCSV